MKSESNNFRIPPIQGIINNINTSGEEVIGYDPSLKDAGLFRAKVVSNLAQFKQLSDVIVTNCITDEILDMPDQFHCSHLSGKD